MPHPSRRTSRARRVASLCCAVGVACALAATAIGSPAYAAKKPKTVVNLAPGEVTVFKTGEAPDALPDDVRTAVMSALTGYTTAATVKPLRKGVADEGALATALAPAVAARLAGTDRAVLVDEGLPKSKGRITVTGTPVGLTALADGGGGIVVVTANIDTTTTTKTKKGKLTIKRAGELVFEPDNGTWKITGYTLTVDRVGKGVKAPAPDPAAPAAPTPSPS